MNAELAARRTAAAAALADYQNGAGTADPEALSLWAYRLASMLGLLLAELDAAGQAAVQSPAAAQLAEIRLVLEAFDWESGDRQYALEQIDDVVNREGQ